MRKEERLRSFSHISSGTLSCRFKYRHKNFAFREKQSEMFSSASLFVFTGHFISLKHNDHITDGRVYSSLWAELCRLVCLTVLHNIFIKLWAAGVAVEMFQTGSLWSFSVSERRTIRRDTGTKHFMIITQSHSPVHWGHCSSRTPGHALNQGCWEMEFHQITETSLTGSNLLRCSDSSAVRRRDAELKKRRFNLSPGRRAASVWCWRWTWSAHHQTLLKNLQCCTQKPATEENSSLPPTGSDTCLIVSLSLPAWLRPARVWTIVSG